VPGAIAGARPLSDFINAQGTTNIFIPPVPDYIGWCGEDTRPPIRFALVDYAGLAAKWRRRRQGSVTRYGGDRDVNERVLPDGRTQVTVNLSTTNALTWVVDCSGDFSTDPLLFGYRAQDLLANPSLQPGLSTVHASCLHEYGVRCSAAGPCECVHSRERGAGSALLTLSFHSDGFGQLHSALESRRGPW
jgi:hypothetical protein